MKLYNEPIAEVVVFSIADIIQTSTNTLAGDDPYMKEPEGWVNSQS